MAEEVHEGPVIGHYGDHRAQTVWSPAHYATGPLEGPGRWCRVYAPMIGKPVGVLYTDDVAILGYLPVAAVRRPNSPHIAHVVGVSLLQAAALSRPVSEVFDAWAARAAQGLACGRVISGDLRHLPR